MISKYSLILWEDDWTNRFNQRRSNLTDDGQSGGVDNYLKQRWLYSDQLKDGRIIVVRSSAGAIERIE